MKTSTQPTAAAMRAARAVMDANESMRPSSYAPLRDFEYSELAAVIDRETALPLLIQVLEELLDAYAMLYSDATDDQYGQPDGSDPRVRQARAALKQAKGE